MKRINIMSSGALLLIAAFLSCNVNRHEVVIKNDTFVYRIDKTGRNLSFVDKRNNIDYLKAEDSSYCASVTLDGKTVYASKVEMPSANEIRLWFGDTGVSATLRMEKQKDHIIFEVAEFDGKAESLNFMNIPLKLNGMPDEPFAGCVLALNPFTHVRQLPALQTQLWANAYERFNIKGARIALLGTTPGNMLALIRDVISKSPDIPASTKGGAWAQDNKEGYGSYIMSFGGVTEKTVDAWIEMCKNLGFNQIDHHGGGFFNFGELKIDSVTYPNGWSDFRAVNRKLKAAGISSIFHTYAYFIDKNSKYVTPVMHPDLGYFKAFTLAKAIGENDTEIYVNESTADVSTVTGFFVRNSVSLSIGGELIEFTGVTKTAPYKFTGCKRGVAGTHKKAHPANEKAYHMKEVYGRFIPDPESDLFKEIARKTAEVVNEAEFSGIYLDAVDGGDVLGGPENFWYYPSKFIFEIVRNLKTPVGMEMASMSHFWWHYRSRWQAWDTPLRGYKRFTDIHLAAIKSPNIFLTPHIKSNDFEHGVWAGDTALINKYAGLPNGALMLPLNLGWYGNQIGVSPQTETTFSDDVEYLASKMLGNNAGTAMVGGYDKGTLTNIPLFQTLDSIIRVYEDLRHAKYFDDSVLAMLRQPGKEFKLLKEATGKWNFKKASYDKRKISGNTSAQTQWETVNSFGVQPIKLRLEALMAVKSYDDPSSVTITDFSKENVYQLAASAKGVSGTTKFETEGYKQGISSFALSGMSDGSSPVRGSWVMAEKSYDPVLDIHNNQGLGVWVKGDGKGEVLNIRLESPKHISHGARGDRYIIIDFTGWKYFDLLEMESSRFTDYIWPVSDLHVYDSYRHSVSFKEINKLQFWLNNIPSNEEATVLISPVKAIAMVKEKLINPSVILNGKKLTFNVTMESGMYLEFFSADDCKLFGSNGNLIQQVSMQEDIPQLQAGKNQLSFECGSTGTIKPRIQITTISYGDAIIKYK